MHSCAPTSQRILTKWQNLKNIVYFQLIIAFGTNFINHCHSHRQIQLDQLLRKLFNLQDYLIYGMKSYAED